MCRSEGECGCTPVSIIMFGREKWVQVLCMYTHLCAGRKGEVDAGVVYVCLPVCRSEGGYGCTPVSIIMFTCVKAEREKWVQVLCM